MEMKVPTAPLGVGIVRKWISVVSNESDGLKLLVVQYERDRGDRRVMRFGTSGNLTAKMIFCTVLTKFGASQLSI